MVPSSDLAIILITTLSAAIPFAYQGYCVLTEKSGYRKDPKYKDHPELKGVRRGDNMMYVNFKFKDFEK